MDSLVLLPLFSLEALQILNVGKNNKPKKVIL